MDFKVKKTEEEETCHRVKTEDNCIGEVHWVM